MTIYMTSQDKDQDFRKATRIVFRLLKFRLRSEHELRNSLTAKNLPAPTVNQAIQYFKDTQIVNDRFFAQQWISSRLKKPFGFIRIRLELKQKGISAGIIQETIAEAARDYDEQTIVNELAKHRRYQYKNLDREKMKQRMYGYLMRRGFNANCVVKTINAL